MAKVILLPGARPENEGEALVLNHLRDQLPGTYTLIPNLEIAEPGRPPFEYDLVVVAPHAVYVVEIKRWRGGIRGDDYNWVIAGQNRRLNPWPTANNKARVLKSQIQNRLGGQGDLWVEAVVVIADDQGELELRGSCRARVFRYPDLPGFLTDAAALGNKAGNLRPLRGAIESAIQYAGRGRTDRVLRYGDYEVLETLSRRDTVAEFLAHNVLLRGEEKVRLRVFSYDPYLPAEEQGKRREMICREAEALQKIGRHSNLIALQTFFTDTQDPNLFVEVTDWSEEGTLRALMTAAVPLSLQRKLELAQGIAAGLKAAHDAQVIHRDVRPENILIGRDDQPRLMNFDHARLSSPSARTISPIRVDPDLPQAYVAPEILDPLQPTTPAADFYGMGMILFEMLTGTTLFDKPEDARDQSTSALGPAAYAADIPARLDALVCQMLHADPQRRPQNAAEVLEELRAIREKPSGTVVEAPSPPQPETEPTAEEVEPAVFPVGALIDGKYRVQRVLEAGGFGRVYKAYDAVLDQVFAVKVFEGTGQALDALRQEAQSLRAVSHPNIVRFHGWGQLPRTGRVYLVTEFIEGQDLTAYTTPDRRLPVREAVNAVLQLLAALESIHPDVERIQELKNKGELSSEEYEEYARLLEGGLLHRDIKPANLILSPDGLVLVDFNIAVRARQAGKTWIGTLGYMLPEVGMMRWDTDGDLFATGIVLYELVTGHHPYPDRQPNAETLPTGPREYAPELHPAFVKTLLRAVSCETELRYHSARRFRQDLLKLDGLYLQAVGTTSTPIALTLEDDEKDRANYNPYVTRFLRLYSQGQDNSGTRGLDEIAHLTYVETRLDRLLRPAVLDGTYRLVIITGNAGDGKTAFIQKLESAATPQAIAHAPQNSSVFTHNGVRFLANYDGSQDEGTNRTNDQVLAEFFAAFDDDHFDHPLPESTVHIIAINEGRLIDFFEPTLRLQQAMPAQPARFRHLGQALARFFEGDEEHLPSWLLIVDLNRRSVVARDPDTGNTSIFDRQLTALLKPEFWEPCQACAFRERCPIYFNVSTLADVASGPEVRERLRTLFEIVHLRRHLHITMRDMRSALSWLIFRDRTCKDVADLLTAHPSPPPQDLVDLLYYNAYAADGHLPQGRADDRLVSLLRQIDPAAVANPTADRALHFRGLPSLPRLAFENRGALAETWLEEWQLPVGWEATQRPEIAQEVQSRHALLRRMAFFERRDDWMGMLPYQNLTTFRQITQSPDARIEDLTARLVEGISRAEGARHTELARQFVCLRAGQTSKAKIKSFRLFPQADFKVGMPSVLGGRYLEYTPDQIVLYYAPQDAPESLAELSISLDLLELLVQVREGFAPSLDDIQGFFINLVVFENALAHLPYRGMVLTRDEHRFYKLSLGEGAEVTLHPWSAERMAGDETVA